MPKIIPYVYCVNKNTNQRISKFSVLPYGNADEWELVAQGFTIQWDDGTEGCCRPPFNTRAEAQAFLDRNPNFGGMSKISY